jgi:hypothetical protein
MIARATCRSTVSVRQDVAGGNATTVSRQLTLDICSQKLFVGRE